MNLATSSDLLYLGAALLCAAIAAVFDVRSRRVPNFITGPAILFGLYLHLVLGGWWQMGSSALAGFLCGSIFVVFYLAGGMGAGDVKLMAAVGCLGGLPHAASLLIFTALSGGILAVCLALSRGRLKETLINVGALVLHHRHEGLQPHPQLNLLSPKTLRLPYALAIAAGSASTCWLMLVER